MEFIIDYIVILMPIAFFSILICIIHNVMKRRRCELEVQGIVIDKLVKRQKSYRGYESPYTIAIIIKYEYNNHSYLIEKTISPINLKKNDIVPIRINPNNPKEFYSKMIKDDFTSIMLIIQIVSISLILIISYIGIRRK